MAYLNTRSDVAARRIGSHPVPKPILRETHERRRAFRDILEAARHLAKADGSSIERFLVHNSHLSDDALYRGLADLLGLRFFAHPLRLDPTISPFDALNAGLAPVGADPHLATADQPAFVYAPQGERLDWLIAHLRQSLTLPDMRIAITTPANFLASVRATFGATLAKRAVAHIAHQHPRATARHIDRRRVLLLIGAFIGVVATGFLGARTVWHAAVLGLTCFPVLPGLALRALALRAAHHAARPVPLLSDAALPSYSVLVPVYKEAAILRNLVAHLSALDYPKAKLDIKLLIEADDVETLTALQEISLPPYFDCVVCPRGAPRTKPRALTIGLAYTKSDYVVVYDAEDMPEPDQLKKAAAIFAQSESRLACLQARLVIDNVDDSWLTRQFALEYAGLFDVVLDGFAALNYPVPLGGTSNHFRRAALADVLGWDPWNVTEDADLGLRLYRSGYRVATLPSSTHEEAPATFAAWHHQRTRWLKGWMQTALVHMRPHCPTRDKLHGVQRFRLALQASLSPLCTLFHPVLLMGLGAAMIAVTPDASRTRADDIIWSAFALLTLGSVTLDVLTTRRGAQARKIEAGWFIYLGLIPYSMLKCGAAWRALFELIYAPFYWRKTAHGLAKTSRRAMRHPVKKAF